MGNQDLLLERNKALSINGEENKEDNSNIGTYEIFGKICFEQELLDNTLLHLTVSSMGPHCKCQSSLSQGFCELNQDLRCP